MLNLMDDSHGYLVDISVLSVAEAQGAPQIQVLVPRPLQRLPQMSSGHGSSKGRTDERSVLRVAQVGT